jgi:HlyD family type I secretion membrane fusion protein
MSGEVTRYTVDLEASKIPSGRGAIRFGLVTVLVAFGGFGTWAVLAPLNSAAVAHGEVKVESYRKTVQHRDGGTIRKIAVAEGDRVVAGQPLVIMDDTTVRARWRQLLNNYYDSLAGKARLIAERDQASDVDFAAVMPPGVDDPRIVEVERAQRNLFHARRTMLDGQISVLERRIDQLNREAEALVIEQGSKKRQLALIQDEAGTAEELMKKGLGLRPRLLGLKREAARLEGERDDFSAQIARVHQTIAQTELEIANVSYRHLDQVASDLNDADAEIHDLEQQLTAAEDVLKRTIVRSPQDGVVVGLRVHTPGGVVTDGEALMDVVPQDDVLIVEAQIKPEDIDRVQAGRPAQVRLRTFMRGLTPPATGTVTKVSADLIRDEHQNNQSFYVAQIQLDPASLTKLPGPLSPGMQADVLVATGERTALQYMVEPLAQAMALAFREK